MTKRLKKSKEHRKAFVASQIKIGIPFQIRALRNKREWSQKQLADAAGMLQPRICAMESPGYGSLTLKTLQSIAAAFDVGLVVRFAPFSELAKWSDNFSPDDFSVPSFDEEIEQYEPGQSTNVAGNIVEFKYVHLSAQGTKERIIGATGRSYVDPHADAPSNVGAHAPIAETAYSTKAAA